MQKQFHRPNWGRGTRVVAALVFAVLVSAFRLGAQAPPAVHGTGTTNTITLWTSSTTIGNSVLTQSGNNINLPGTFSATGFTCPACIGNTQLSINYAGSSTQGGAANNALNLGGFPSSAFALLGANNSFTGSSNSFSGAITAASFGGDGSALSNVNAAKLGGILPGGFAQLGASNNSFSGNLSVGGTFSAGSNGSFTGNVSVGGTLSAGTFSANTINSDGGFQINGTPVLTGGAANNSSLLNAAIGVLALPASTTGVRNTAAGAFALTHNTAGGGNTAAGAFAMLDNTTGGFNTGIGDNALIQNTTGNGNTALGDTALGGLTTGSSNIAIGVNAGAAFTGSESNNIDIYNTGMAGDSGVIRIGNETQLPGCLPNTVGCGAQTATFIAGIFGASTSGVGMPVLVDANGQLATSGNGSFAGNLSVGGVLSAGTLSASTFSVAGTLSASTFSANTVNAANSYQIGGAQVLSTGTGTSANLSSLYVGQSAGGTGSSNTGTYNAAIGAQALFSNTTGAYNTGIGVSALFSNTTGSGNTGIGGSTLSGLTSGSSNIAIGLSSGNGLTGNESNNIDIYNFGVAGDSGVIRIGNQTQPPVCAQASTTILGCGAQTTTFIAGIFGSTTASAATSPVLVDPNGQLGTIASSRRYKEDIQDMAAASDALLRLRPVTFRYKKAYADGSKPIQYGLIAEEVAEVYPDLVVNGRDGQPETVQYYKLDAMLLNEVQKLAKLRAADQAEIAKLRSEIAEQRQEVQGQQAAIKDLREQMQALQITLAQGRSADGNESVGVALAPEATKP